VTRYIWSHGYSAVTAIYVRKSTLQSDASLKRTWHRIILWDEQALDWHSRDSCSKLCRLITCPEKELPSLCTTRPYKCRVSTSIKSQQLPSTFFLRHSEVNLPVHAVSPSNWQRCKVTDGTRKNIRSTFLWLK